MRASRILLIIWLLIGIALLVINFRYGITWIISVFLINTYDSQRKRELKSKKGVPSYIR